MYSMHNERKSVIAERVARTLTNKIYKKMASVSKNDRKKFSCLKKLKILCLVRMLLMILMENKLLEHSTKKNCEKQIKKSLALKK